MKLSTSSLRGRLRRYLSTPGTESKERLSKWEANWQVEAERPDEDLSQVLPTEVKEAVRTGWFVPGSAVFDIGSGRGQISAWLAEQGFSVLAGELTEAGTDLAKRHFAGLDNIEFRVLDICQSEPEPARFDGLLDRGTFHCIPDAWCDAYVRNVAKWAKPGASYLLFHKLRGGAETPLEDRQRELDERIRGQLAPYFECERSAATQEEMVRSAGEVPRRTWPGMVFWMTRRANAVI